MPRKEKKELIRGHTTHQRTEGDYVSALLETVTLDDWRDGVSTGPVGRARTGCQICSARGA